MVGIRELDRCADETTEEIFLIIEKLFDKLYDGNVVCQDLVDRAEAIQKACLFALAQGTDNVETVKRLQALSGIKEF